MVENYQRGLAVVGATAASSNMNDEAILVVHYIADYLSLYQMESSTRNLLTASAR